MIQPSYTDERMIMTKIKQSCIHEQLPPSAIPPFHTPEYHQPTSPQDPHHSPPHASFVAEYLQDPNCRRRVNG